MLREHNIARTDFLTGISNSRYFFELIDMEIKRAYRQNSFISIIYLDLDNFKEINDAFGHTEGDSVLKKAAETLKHNVRAIDIPARLGGDEFAILMPDTDFDESEKVAQRVKSALNSTMSSNGWDVTASMGAITCPGRKCTVNSLIKAADRLMFEVKLNGRNGLIHKQVDAIADQFRGFSGTQGK